MLIVAKKNKSNQEGKESREQPSDGARPGRFWRGKLQMGGGWACTTEWYVCMCECVCV